MTFKTISKLFAISIITIFVVGCTTSKNLNMYQKSNLLQSEENNLIKSSIELSETLNQHENTLSDSSYNQYPNKILQRLLEDDKLHFSKDINFHIKVIRNPTINAFALPNGSIYIHTGLLAKIKNEAQLALLIGHEMSHVIHKHSLKQKENMKTGAVISQLFGIVTAPIDAGLLSALLYGSSISGYSQTHEKEADSEGYDQIVKAGYDPIEASKLFDIMLEDIKLNKIKQPYFFSTHPRVQERIVTSKEIIEKKYKNIQGIINESEYLEYAKPIIIENVELDLKLRRFESAEFSINFLKELKESDHNYLKAELLRLKRDENSFDKSLKQYQLALTSNEKDFKAYRGMGYLYFQHKKKAEAKDAFEKYLTLNQNAEDKEYILQYINLCQ